MMPISGLGFQRPFAIFWMSSCKQSIPITHQQTEQVTVLHCGRYLILPTLHYKTKQINIFTNFIIVQYFTTIFLFHRKVQTNLIVERKANPIYVELSIPMMKFVFTIYSSLKFIASFRSRNNFGCTLYDCLDFGLTCIGIQNFLYSFLTSDKFV